MFRKGFWFGYSFNNVRLFILKEIMLLLGYFWGIVIFFVSVYGILGFGVL